MKLSFSSILKAVPLLLLPASTSVLYSVDPPTGERVSVSSTGVQANSASYRPWASESGRYVCFYSSASNLVASDGNGTADVFVRDRQTGETIRGSEDVNGNEGNGPSSSPSISSNGRYLAFRSGATNLVPGDTNGFDDVFVKDLATGEIELVSTNAMGEQGNTHSSSTAISPDGTLVLFESQATNLVPGSSTNHNVFLKNLITGAIELISVDSDENIFTGSAYIGNISRDGNLVAFTLEGFDGGGFRCYVRDRAAGTTTRISVNDSGTAANNYAYGSTISEDGRFAAFESNADNLVTGDTNFVSDVFVRDLVMGKTTRVSVDSMGNQSDSGSYLPWLSRDGRYVAFVSDATNLIASDTNGQRDVFVHDRVTGTTVRVSDPGNGTETNGASNNPFFAAWGNTVIITSNANNLADGDTNGSTDIFATTNPLFVPAYKPDNHIGKDATLSSAVGDGRYNTSGVGQGVILKSRKAHAVRAYVFAENDGTGEDSLRVLGGRGNRFFHFLYSDGGNQTAAVTAGTFATAMLAPGESERLDVVIKPDRKKLRKVKNVRGRKKVKWLSKKYFTLVKSVSTTDTAMADAVSCQVKHR